MHAMSFQITTLPPSRRSVNEVVEVLAFFVGALALSVSSWREYLSLRCGEILATSWIPLVADWVFLSNSGRISRRRP